MVLLAIAPVATAVADRRCRIRVQWSCSWSKSQSTPPCANLTASIARGQVRRPMVLLGTSLGGAMAVDFALAHPEAVAALVLASPQCYTDGIGPMSGMPRAIARLGVAVGPRPRGSLFPAM